MVTRHKKKHKHRIESEVLAIRKMKESLSEFSLLLCEQSLGNWSDLVIVNSCGHRGGGVPTLPKRETNIIMNGRTVWLFLLLCSTGAALQMTGPSTYEASVGSIAQIPCTFTADKLPIDPKHFAVIWYLEDKTILSYDKIVRPTDPRYSLDIDQALNGIAHLNISNTFLSDGGTYTCLVSKGFLNDKKEINVNISARPLLSILSKSVQRNTENNLTCMANGFFPNEINVTWYKDGEVMKNQSMGKPLQYDNGTYQVNSTVTITPNDDDRNKMLSCRIQHVSLQGPLQEDFQITYQGSSSHVGIIIGIVIAVAVIIAGLVWWKREKICREGVL